MRKDRDALGEDIDAVNADAVFWSLAYRTNLNEDVHVSPYRAPGHGPNRGRGERRDAPHRRDPKHPMPPFALPAVSSWNARRSYGTSWVCRMNSPPPWYAIRWRLGCELGPLGEVGNRGKWEEMGRETFAAGAPGSFRKPRYARHRQR